MIPRHYEILSTPPDLATGLYIALLVSVTLLLLWGAKFSMDHFVSKRPGFAPDYMDLPSGEILVKFRLSVGLRGGVYQPADRVMTREEYCKRWGGLPPHRN